MSEGSDEVGVRFDALEDMLEDGLSLLQVFGVGSHLDAAQIAIHGFGAVEHIRAIVVFPVDDIEAVCLLDDSLVVNVSLMFLVEELVESIKITVGNEGVFSDFTADGNGVLSIGESDEHRTGLIHLPCIRNVEKVGESSVFVCSVSHLLLTSCECQKRKESYDEYVKRIFAVHFSVSVFEYLRG